MTAERKRFALEHLLAQEPAVYLLINPDVPNVVLPPLTMRPVVLLLGLNLPVPILDLRITDEGWSATLSFNRRPFKVEVPWSAVCEIVNDDCTRGIRFPEDYPKDIDQQVEARATTHRELRAAEKRKTLPPGWGVIEGGKKDEEGAA